MGISAPFINSCDERETIKKELTDLWNYEKYGCPHKEGNKYFFSKNSGLQNQSVIYVQDSLEAEPKVLIDPNGMGDDGTVSLRATSWSHDGSILAYGLSKSGSDWTTIKFRNVETGEDFEEEIEKVKFSGITWTHDNKGVFYGCYPDHDLTCATGKDTKSHENQKLYYHRVGTKQAQDVLCVEFPEQPKWMIDAAVSDCGRYLFVMASQDCKYNLLHFCDLEVVAKDGINSKFALTEIVTKFDADYDFVTNQGTKCVFHTNKGAQNFKLVTIDLTSPSESSWVDLVPEGEDVLEWATGVAGDKLITCYMHDVKNTMQLRDLSTGNQVYSFPMDIGSVTGFSGDIRHKEMFYKFTVGYAWVSNYGCSDVADEFQNLLGISPLHNIKERDDCQYPAVLLLTADHDDRVVPSHSLKYIATLQNTLKTSAKQTNPLMIRVDTKSGHGAGKPTSKSIEEYTEMFCFLVKSLGIQYKK